jgi:Concanavalin A-like lectin/glucanases superfamily
MRLPLAGRLVVLVLSFLSAVRGFSAASDPVDATTTIWKLETPDRLGGNATTVLGKPETVTGGEFPELHFNGVCDGLLVPVNPLAGWKEFTIEVLFKPDADGPAEQRFLHIQDTSSGDRALLEIRMTPTGWALDSFLYSVQVESKLPLLDRTKLHPADRWTWVALVYANGHMAHYIDGVMELEGKVNFAPMTAGQISLGVRQNKVFWFKGGIAEVRFHPAALTPEQLQREVAR